MYGVVGGAQQKRVEICLLEIGKIDATQEAGCNGALGDSSRLLAPSAPSNPTDCVHITDCLDMNVLT